MAPRSEAIVIAADVGRLHGPELAKHNLHVSRSILLNKVLYGGKNDAVGLMLFGTTTTQNDMHRECAAEGDDSQYLNICTLYNSLSVITPALLKNFGAKDQEFAGGKSDILDALMVAYGLLIKDPLLMKSKRPKIVLVSNFLDLIKPLDDSFRDQCMAGLTSSNVEVELVSLSPLSSIPKENRDLIEHMNEIGVSSFEFVQDYEGYAAFREIKLVQPARTKHWLCIGEDLQIPVSVYKKVTKAGISKNFKIKHFHKDENNNVYEAKRETEYKKVDDPDTIIEDKTRAFPYGKDLIPIDENTADFLSFKEDKSLLLLGFKERECFPQHSFLGEAWIVLPDPESIGAQESLSAMVRTLDEKDQVAIVRCVLRANAEAFLSVWIPFKSAQKDTTPDSFIMCMLPFAEDLREYQFASLNACEKWIPSDEELRLAENIIESMSLMGDDVQRIIPEKIANPTIHNMHQYLAKKLSSASGKKTSGSGDAKEEELYTNKLGVLAGPSEESLKRAKPYIAKLAELVKSKNRKEE